MTKDALANQISDAITLSATAGQFKDKGIEHDYVEECALGSFMGVSCYVRTWKDGSKFEVEFTDQTRNWLTDARLANENGETVPCGELNKQYLYKKLGEFIAMNLKDKNT